MKDTPSVDLNYLWMMLHQTRDAIFKLREKELNKFGISTPKAEILFTIEAIGYRATPTEISRHVLREFHSVSSILSRMEKQGLVKKVNDLDRKNMVRVCLTDKGHQVYHEAVKRETIVKILSCLSETEGQQLASSLKKLRDEALKDLGIEERVNLLGY
ncbi:MAG: winged helix DNA-binding protein [Desulfobacteraceae bacterium]|nr:winged helix DNA-binding protein [Desulfobacteraceae bacterium]